MLFSPEFLSRPFNVPLSGAIPAALTRHIRVATADVRPGLLPAWDMSENFAQRAMLVPLMIAQGRYRARP